MQRGPKTHKATVFKLGYKLPTLGYNSVAKKIRNKILDTHTHIPCDLVVYCKKISLQQRMSHIRKGDKYKKVVLECSIGGRVL